MAPAGWTFQKSLIPESLLQAFRELDRTGAWVDSSGHGTARCLRVGESANAGDALAEVVSALFPPFPGHFRVDRPKLMHVIAHQQTQIVRREHVALLQSQATAPALVQQEVPRLFESGGFGTKRGVDRVVADTVAVMCTRLANGIRPKLDAKQGVGSRVYLTRNHVNGVPVRVGLERCLPGTHFRNDVDKMVWFDGNHAIFRVSIPVLQAGRLIPGPPPRRLC